MNSWQNAVSQDSFPSFNESQSEDLAYLPHISTYLPRFRQKSNPSHPLLKTEPRLARKVMKMGDQSLQHIFHARILA